MKVLGNHAVTSSGDVKIQLAQLNTSKGKVKKGNTQFALKND